MTNASFPLLRYWAVEFHFDLMQYDLVQILFLLIKSLSTYTIPHPIDLLAVVRAGIALDDNRTTLVQMNRSQRWMFKCLVNWWRLIDAILLWFPENYEYWIRIWRNCLTIPTTTSKLLHKTTSCIVPSFFKFW
jgi:hypothetical protein